MTAWRCLVLAVCLAGIGGAAASAQQETLPDQTAGSAEERTAREARPPSRLTQLEQLQYALVRLPLAAGLASALALRPRRRGTPHRRAPVIQTQIILAIVGAVVMLVVGSSLARAFGIVGAAGLVRYRAKIDDPKDAGVMLSTLAVGLAAGVGLWMLALFATGFILLVLGIIESFEPRTTLAFELQVKAKDAAALKPKVEQLMRRAKLDYEMRTTAEDELC